MKYQKEYDEWLSIIKETRNQNLWITDEEWSEYFDEILNMNTPQQFDANMDEGIQLGLSPERQLEIARKIFKLD